MLKVVVKPGSTVTAQAGHRPPREGDAHGEKPRVEQVQESPARRAHGVDAEGFGKRPTGRRQGRASVGDPAPTPDDPRVTQRPQPVVRPRYMSRPDPRALPPLGPLPDGPAPPTAPGEAPSCPHHTTYSSRSPPLAQVPAARRTASHTRGPLFTFRLPFDTRKRKSSLVSPAHPTHTPPSRYHALTRRPFFPSFSRRGLSAPPEGLQPPRQKAA